jgi:cysteine sulfinate desulfinase/cysteine desulfurase-like protein
VIFLDHHAAPPIVPEVMEAMMPCLTSEWSELNAALAA